MKQSPFNLVIYTGCFCLPVRFGCLILYLFRELMLAAGRNSENAEHNEIPILMPNVWTFLIKFMHFMSIL